MPVWSETLSKWGTSVVIPPPLLVVIEDVGWWSGFSQPESNGPYRTGMGRMHVPEDYEALVRLARLLGTQIVAGFVFCEWDRKGILGEIPSATWLGSTWRGNLTGVEFQDRVVSILNENQDNVMMALHGVGHEYWVDGKADRSEFHDPHGVMRDKDDLKRHLRAFFRIRETTGLQTSLPRIFIPPALKHSFGNGNDGFQSILYDFGIRHVLTVFDKALKYQEPLFPNVTEECGVLILERGIAPVSWDRISAEPRFAFDHPVIPLHWANILHTDPERNGDVVDNWVDYLKEGAKKNGFVFLKDTLSSLCQMVFYHLANIKRNGNETLIDIRDVRRVMPGLIGNGFYVELPPSARVNEKEVTLDQAVFIKDGLVKLTPTDGSDFICIST